MVWTSSKVNSVTNRLLSLWLIFNIGLDEGATSWEDRTTMTLPLWIEFTFWRRENGIMLALWIYGRLMGMGTFKTWNKVENVNSPTWMSSINVPITSLDVLSYSLTVYAKGVQIVFPRQQQWIKDKHLFYLHACKITWLMMIVT